MVTQELQNLDSEKLFNKVMSLANDGTEYQVFTRKNRVYINVGYLIGELKRELQLAPSEEEVAKYFGMEIKEVRIYKGKDLVKDWTKYFVSEYDVHRYSGLEERKRSSPSYRGFRIEEREEPKIDGNDANSGSA